MKRFAVGVWHFLGITPLEARRVALSFARAALGGLAVAAIAALTDVLSASVGGVIVAASISAGLRATQLRSTTWERDPALPDPDVDPDAPGPDVAPPPGVDE